MTHVIFAIMIDMSNDSNIVQMFANLRVDLLRAFYERIVSLERQSFVNSTAANVESITLKVI